ncbi:MAG TPA: hypothetical protein VFK16_05500 [Gemmatimonadaceae bacterium]|nr:hypothetical protein [Gemmatimonadaceae bacterium]
MRWSLWGSPSLRPQAVLAGLVALVAVSAPAPRDGVRGPLPAALDDSTFWRLSTSMSEPGGFFRSDNFVSNETNYQRILDALDARTPKGGVYLGVGPDQNFTYIVELRPRLAFVVDIRRQALLQQLMYKALFDLSPTRADFLGRLFCRPLADSLHADVDAAVLMRALAVAVPDTACPALTLRDLDRQLTVVHTFPLSAEDLDGIAYVYQSFVEIGPDITYSGDPTRSRSGRFMPGYATMVTETDSAGVNRGYLGSEARYQAIREFERANLLVPVVGDFAGSKALRAVGDYVREHGARVSLFYTSNVEQYLFRNPEAWRRFYANVAALPLDPGSLFIRAVFGGGGYGYGYGYGGQRGGGYLRGEMLVTPIATTLAAFDAGEIQGYWDVLRISR